MLLIFLRFRLVWEMHYHSRSCFRKQFLASTAWFLDDRRRKTSCGIEDGGETTILASIRAVDHLISFVARCIAAPKNTSYMLIISESRHVRCKKKIHIVLSKMYRPSSFTHLNSLLTHPPRNQPRTQSHSTKSNTNARNGTHPTRTPHGMVSTKCMSI